MLKKIIESNKLNYRHMSNFVSQYNENHIPTSPLQKILLSVGSATVSLFDPQRAGIIKILIYKLSSKIICSLLLSIS